MSLKLVYITLYPEKYPRVKKIATTLKDQNITFQALTPKIRVKLGNKKIERLISAFVRYTFFLLQIFLTDADIYWVANSPDLFALPLILRKQKYILDYRSPWPLEIELEFGKGKLSQMAEFLSHTALKHSKVITLTTSTLLRDVKKFRKQVYVIPNYPQKNSFKPNVSYDHFRKLHNVKKDQKIILFVGLLSISEGADILPSIVKELLQKTKKIALWIVGDGVLRSLAEELERKFPEIVTFFGWRPYKEMPNFVNAADVCIVPRHKTPFSHYYNEEGVHKISEYMLLRKPIVACGIAPSKEYLLTKRPELTEGILEALEGKVPKPTPRTWEDDCKQEVLELIEFMKKTPHTR